MGLVNYSFTAIKDTDPDGANSIANQAVSVKNEIDLSFPVIYEDAAGLTPIAQPGAVTDGNGVLEFWVLPGYYVVESGSRTENILIDDGSRLSLTDTTKISGNKHLKEGDKVFWRGYYSESDGGSNWGIVKSGAHTADGGSVFSISASLYVSANLKGKTINTRKFGVKADGIADDTAATQNTIDYLESIGGGSAKSPVGDCLVSDLNSDKHAILLKTNVNFVGFGRESKITLDPSIIDTDLAFDFRVIATGDFTTAYSNIKIGNLYINGNQEAIGGLVGAQTAFIQGIGNSLRTTPLSTASNIKIKKAYIFDTNIGVGYSKNIDDQHFSSSRLDAQFSDIHVSKCTVEKAQNKAIELQESRNSSIKNNWCLDVEDGPQLINSSRQSKIMSNHVFYKNFGISLTHNVKDCEVAHNYVECVAAGGGFGSMIFRTESYATVSQIENIRVHDNTFKDPVNRLNLRFIGKITNVICEFNDIFIYDNTFYDQINFYEEVYSGSVFNNIQFTENEVKWTFLTKREADSSMSEVLLEGNKFIRSTTFSGTGWDIKDNTFDNIVTFDVDSNSNITRGNRFKVLPVVDNGTTNKGILNSNINGTQLWFTQSGSANTAASPIVFPEEFAFAPHVVCTPFVPGGARMISLDATPTTKQFEVAGYNSSGASSDFNFHWVAFGRQ